MLRASLIALAAAGSAFAAVPATAQDFTKTDHFVAYHPTVGGHVGHSVLPLYVRHVAASNPAGSVAEENRVVLFIHGGTTPVAAGYDLEGYSWMEALAAEGFDVWALDHTGYGGSARPNMDDPCNVDPALQTSLLVGNILDAECAANHPLRFNTIRGEWEEIDATVDYILAATGASSVSLVGWSAGGPRSGGYALLHPEKVNRLFLFAPVAGNPNLQLVDSPAEGPLTTLRDKAGFGAGWESSAAACPGIIEDGALDAYWDASMTWDAVGSTWGPEGGPGYVRGPLRTASGWTPDMVGQVTHPVLVIGGEQDTSVRPESQRAVFDGVASESKVFVSIACATHFLLWERDREILHDASIEWLRDGTYRGVTSGEFRFDEAGNVAAVN